MTVKSLLIAMGMAGLLGLSMNVHANFLSKMNEKLEQASSAVDKVKETTDKATGAVQGTVQSVQDTGQAVQDTKEDMTTIGKDNKGR